MWTDFTRRCFALLLLAAATLLTPGCSTNPATGQSSFTAFMSPQDEKRVGAEEHPKLVEQFGGTYADASLAAYVSRVGQAVAKHAEIQDVSYTFTVLDDDDINAFALPGGYVHVTRGLLTLASNEAELAGVLGHEIGHVTARHAAQRYSSATAANLGIGILSILGAVAGLPSQIAQAAGSGLQTGAAMYLQKYSRDQEMEADRLGIRYMTAAGYDPEAMGTFFRKLDVWTRLEASMTGDGEAVDRFDIMASHPRTGDRVQQATQVAALARKPGEQLDQDAYLKAIDGVLFGDSPAQGFRRGREFIHPQLRIAFTVPPGFVLKNTAQQVVAVGPNGAVVVFDTERRQQIARQVPDMATYLTRAWASNVPLASVGETTINGAEAASGVARLQTRGGGTVIARLVAIRGGPDRIWRFAFLAAPADAQRLQGEFQQTAMSFRLLTAAQAAAVKPWRIDVVTVQAGDTPERLAERMAVDSYRLETFRAINGLDASSRLTPGQQVKIVIG
ncbi:MAG: M48 family metalloprotease [Rhodospirillales bacterium]